MKFVVYVLAGLQREPSEHEAFALFVFDIFDGSKSGEFDGSFDLDGGLSVDGIVFGVVDAVKGLVAEHFEEKGKVRFGLLLVTFACADAVVALFDV